MNENETVSKTVECAECRKQVSREVYAAYRDLFGGYRVDLSGLARAIERGIEALAVNRERHPNLYKDEVSDLAISVDAIYVWLGHDLERLVGAVRHRHEEEAAS